MGNTTSIRDLPPMEQLAIEQALYSRLGEDVSTKNPDSLRGMVDVDMVENYRNTGYKSRDVFVNGHKVGTHSVRIGKDKDAQTVRRFEVTSDAALDDWVRGDDSRMFWDAYITSHRAEFAKWYFECMGELPDGCEMVTETVPAQSPQVLGTTLCIDAGKVADAISGYLPTTLARMLEGGGEDA